MIISWVKIDRSAFHISHVIITWCMYVSWMLLFLCVLCILKWLSVQPLLVAMRRRTLSTEQAVELVVIEKNERYACFASKTLLTSSFLFLITHFVLIATK